MSKFTELINDEIPILVDFWAEWCQPCKRMSPILQDVKNQMGEKARIIKVNVDKNPKTAGRYMIQNIPTLLIFKRGKIVFRQSGLMMEGQILHELEKHL